jgi:predicted RNase H-like nuclease (RuvC/YqgF family)
MKKSYLYFLIPLVGLIVFGAYYWKFISEYDAKQEAKVQAVKHIKEQELLAQAHLREKAIKDAIAQQEARKEERRVREEHDRKQREDRENAIQARNKVGTEAEKLQRQTERLAREIKTAKEEIEKIELQKQRALTEQGFLKTYVAKAQENTKRLSQVLDRIAAADDAAARAAAAAAAAAKK